MNTETFATQCRLDTVRDPGDRTAIISSLKGKSQLAQYREGLLGTLLILEVSTAHWWNAWGTAFLGAGGAGLRTQLFFRFIPFRLDLGYLHTT